MRSLANCLAALALGSAATLSPHAFAAETPPPAINPAPGQSPDPGASLKPETTLNARPMAPHTPPPASDRAPGHTTADTLTLPMEPTAAGMSSSSLPEPHAQAVRDAKAQYAQDKVTCREATMTKAEFRDCRKAAKMERDEKFNDSPAQIPVNP